MASSEPLSPVVVITEVAPRERGRVPAGVKHWAQGHSLNRPTRKTLTSHLWPIVAVALMMAVARYWVGFVVFVLIAAVIVGLGLRRPQERAERHRVRAR